MTNHENAVEVYQSVENWIPSQLIPDVHTVKSLQDGTVKLRFVVKSVTQARAGILGSRTQHVLAQILRSYQVRFTVTKPRPRGHVPADGLGNFIISYRIKFYKQCQEETKRKGGKNLCLST